MLPGVWAAAPIVAVGAVVNIRPYGEQEVERLPWPMSPDVHKLYWCEGDFLVTAVVKGELSGVGKKYLWASAQSGCKEWYGDKRSFDRLKTRAWFLREEGEFLRPPFDGGTALFEGFFARWDQRSREPVRRQFGTLLLTPDANSDTLEDYARYLWNVGDIACEVLGKTECVRQLRALAAAGNPTLREDACHFLKGQMDVDCR